MTDNPTRGVEPFRGQKKERFLTDTEVEILGQALVEMERDGSLPWWRARRSSFYFSPAPAAARSLGCDGRRLTSIGGVYASRTPRLEQR